MNRDRILSLLNIRPGEGWLVGWMLVYAFFMGMPALIMEAAAYGLFLEEFSAQAIPYVYVGFAIVTTLSGFIYTSLEKRISFFRFATINLSILTLIPLIFRLLLIATDAHWSLAGLAIWYESSWALTGLGFWSMAAYMFDLRQGKRLFALIGVGLTLSESVAGFLVPGFVSLVGAANLLLVTSVSFIIALVVQTYLLRSYRRPAQPDDSDEQQDSTFRKSFVDLFKNQYIVLIFALAGLYALSFYALDNAFYDQVEVRYLDADQLASFLGIFFGLSGLLTLVLGALVSGALISRYGLRLGLLAMPATILVGATLISFVGSFFEAMVILFWLVIVTKFLNEVLAYTINRAAWQVLYEPLPENQRLRSQTVVESIIKPVSGGLAGVLLIGLNTFFAASAVQIAYLLVIVLILWIVVVLRINRQYPSVLLKALAKRRLADASLVFDKSHIEILKQGLSSPHVGVVVYSVNVLEEIDPESLPQFLQDLLRHPAPQIRQMALHRIERFNVGEAIPAVRELIAHDAEPTVQGSALRTLAVLGGAGVYDEISAYLSQPAPHLRFGAMVGLLRSGGSNGQHLTWLKNELMMWVRSPDREQRILAARVLGEIDIQDFYPTLLKLLYDDKLEVRQAALLATKKLHNPQIWSAVIENLASPKMRATAVAALAAGGREVLPQIEAAIASEKHSRDIVSRLVRICGRIRGPEAISILTRYLDHPVAQVRTQVLTALSQCDYQASEEDRLAIEQRIKLEAGYSAWILAALVKLEIDETLTLVKRALSSDLAQYRLRLLTLLSFIYPAQTIRRVQSTLGVNGAFSGTLWNQQKSYALEIIDVTVSHDLKPVILPLLDNLPSHQRLAKLSAVFPQPQLSRDDYLAEIIGAADSWLSAWTGAAALHAAARLRATRLVPAVTAAASAANDLVRETAIFTLYQLDPQFESGGVGAGRPPDDGENLKPLAVTEVEPKSMLSLVERVLLLKSVSIFSETPEDVLAQVVALLEEIDVQPGDTIIEKGELGNSLYIVIDGEVKVHDGARTIATLGESEVFGEFSLLDPGPRTASVTALEQTRLFRLNQESFLELIEDHSTVARKIMQVLVRYLRNANLQT